MKELKKGIKWGLKFFQRHSQHVSAAICRTFVFENIHRETFHKSSCFKALKSLIFFSEDIFWIYSWK